MLEIKDPNAKEADPYFLTYNKREGMNENTHSGANQLRIVQKLEKGQSILVASIGTESEYKIELWS